MDRDAHGEPCHVQHWVVRQCVVASGLFLVEAAIGDDVKPTWQWKSQLPGRSGTKLIAMVL